MGPHPPRLALRPARLRQAERPRLGRLLQLRLPAYRDSGAIKNLYPQGTNAPVTTTFVGARWTHKITLSQAKPGDLVEPHSGHVAMQLADGYKVHTNQTGDVSKVERAYSSAYWVGWIDPSKV
ncbi:hypothetical protein ACFQY7_49715 [Actinomadura luteofluorescens]|uniref:hypothetical protein n=1 Tax=Actinomadura luteofluorescens TaxID=46163 RepID=UPI00363908E3